MDIEKGKETELSGAWARDEQVITSLRNDAENQPNNIEDAGLPLYSQSKTVTSELKIG